MSEKKSRDSAKLAWGVYRTIPVKEDNSIGFELYIAELDGLATCRKPTINCAGN